jgi:hypothetical protein
MSMKLVEVYFSVPGKGFVGVVMLKRRVIGEWTDADTVAAVREANTLVVNPIGSAVVYEHNIQSYPRLTPLHLKRLLRFEECVDLGIFQKRLDNTPLPLPKGSRGGDDAS